MRTSVLAAAIFLASLFGLPWAAAKDDSSASSRAAAILVVGPLRCESTIRPLGLEMPHPRLELGASVHGPRRAADRLPGASRQLARTARAEPAGPLGQRQDAFRPQRLHAVCGPPLVVADAMLVAGAGVGSGRRRERVQRRRLVGNGLVGGKRLAGPMDRAPGATLGSWTAPVLPAPMFRKEFDLPAGVRTARAYICGLGYYELSLNGRKVGDRVLDPIATIYDRRARYVVYDVTPLLKPGRNAVGATLGNGWYNFTTADAWHFDKASWRDYPKLLLQIEASLDDGRKVVVASDATWKWDGDGPVRFDQLERRDLRRPARTSRLVGARLQRSRLALRRAGSRPGGAALLAMDSALPRDADDRADRRLGSPSWGSRLRHGTEHGRLGATAGARPGGDADRPAVLRAARQGSRHRRRRHRPVRQERRLSDRPLYARRPRRGSLGTGVRLSWLPLRPGERDAGKTGLGKRSRPRRRHGLPPGGRILLLQRPAQPPATVYALVVSLEIRRHPHRLPPSREERLDRRRPVGQHRRPDEFRRRHFLSPMARLDERHAAAQRAIAGHRSQQRLGIQLGRRTGMGPRLPHARLARSICSPATPPPWSGTTPASAAASISFTACPTATSSASAWATGATWARPRRTP